jgi:hypothetical protein
MQFDSEQVFVHVADELSPCVELSQWLSMDVGDIGEDIFVPSVNHYSNLFLIIFTKNHISHVMLHVKNIINVATENN